MQIVVKSITGKTYELEIENWDTVRDIKEKIYDAGGLRPDNQRLIFDDNILRDDDAVFYERYLIQKWQNDADESLDTIASSSSSSSNIIPTVYMVFYCKGGGNVVYHTSVKMQSSSSSSSGSDHESSSDYDSDHLPPKEAVLLRSHALSVPLFDGMNFLDWCEQVLSHLRVLDLDLALQIERPIAITESSSAEERKSYKAWKRSNILSIKFMLITIAAKIKVTLPQTKDAKEFMKIIEERFHKTNEFLIRIVIEGLTTTKFNDTSGIHEHLLKMRAIAMKLMELGMNVDEFFLVQLILNSLPPQYKQFQNHYSTIKDKWNVNELHNLLVEEEARLEQEEHHFSRLLAKGGADDKWKRHGKGINPIPPKSNGSTYAPKKVGNDKCNFCNKSGHHQKDCYKRKA